MDEGADNINGTVSKKASGLARAEQVLRACSEHGLESEARVVCRRMSRSLVEQGQYGVAIRLLCSSIRHRSSPSYRRPHPQRIRNSRSRSLNQIVDSFPRRSSHPLMVSI